MYIDVSVLKPIIYFSSFLRDDVALCYIPFLDQVYPLEGAVSILSGKSAVELSQQEILSCAYEDEEDRNGCNGL